MDKFLHILFGPTLAVIGFFVRHYTANRERLARFKADERVKVVLQVGALIISAAWVIVFVLAPEGSGDRLTRELRQGLDAVTTPPAQDVPGTGAH